MLASLGVHLRTATYSADTKPLLKQARPGPRNSIQRTARQPPASWQLTPRTRRSPGCLHRR
jgi:hypothetical protein